MYPATMAATALRADLRVPVFFTAPAQAFYRAGPCGESSGFRREGGSEWVEFRGRLCPDEIS